MRLKYLIIIPLVLLIATQTLEARQVGNINDDDKTIERVTTTYDGKIIAWDKKGYMLQGWPVKLEGREFILPPVLFDVDMNEEKDVLTIAETAGGRQEFHAFNGKGEELQYLTFNIRPGGGVKVTAVPILVDITGDGIYEVAYGATDGQVRVFRPDMVPAAGFAGLNIGGAPVVYSKDTDKDGVPELFAANDTKIYRWNSPEARVELFAAAPATKIKGEISFFDLESDFRYEIMFATTDNRIHVIDYAGTPVLDIEMDEEMITGPPVPADVDLDGEWEVLVPTNLQKLRAFEINYLIARRAEDVDYLANADGYVASWDYTISYRNSNLPTIDAIADDTYIGSFMSEIGYDQGIVYRSKIGYSALEYGEFAHQYDLFAPLHLVDFVRITDVISHPAVFTPNGDGVNDTVRMMYRLDTPAEVSLVITDLRHRPVATVIEHVGQGAGPNELVWNGVLPDGNPAATGNYIGRIRAKNRDGVITTADANIIVNGIKAQIEKPYDPNTADQAYPRVYGTISIEGVAIDPNVGERGDNADFISYNLYLKKGVRPVNSAEAVRAGNDNNWQPFISVPLENQCIKERFYLPHDARYPESNVSCRPVQHGLLGYFDTTAVPNGYYTILLKTMDSGGNDPAKISYDTLFVHVENPRAGLPFDANNPYSMNNPANPVYRNPAISADVSMEGPALSTEHPVMDVDFFVDETSDVRILVHKTDETCTETGPVVFVKEFDNAVKDEYINFEWYGTTPLGRHVTGGKYKMVITATASDGSGYSEVGARCFDVERGFASSDTLEIDVFDTTPVEMLLAGNIAIGGEPEHITLHYEFSKFANASIYVFRDDPEEHANDADWLLANNIKLIVKDWFSEEGTFAWYGERANGALVVDLDKVYVLLVADSVDQGNEDRKYTVLEVPVKKPRIDRSVTASVDHLTGEKDGGGLKTVAKEGETRNLAGDPSFYWLAWGKGRVELDVQSKFSGKSSGQRYIACNQRKPVRIKACGPPNMCSGDKKGCEDPPPHALTAYAEMDVIPECQVMEFGANMIGANVDIEDMAFVPDFVKKERIVPNPECQPKLDINGRASGCQPIQKNGRYYVPPPTVPRTLYLYIYPKVENATGLDYTRNGNNLHSDALGRDVSIFEMMYRQRDPETSYGANVRQPRRLKYRAHVFENANLESMAAVCHPTEEWIDNCASDPNLDEDPFNDVDVETGELRHAEYAEYVNSLSALDAALIARNNIGYRGLIYNCGTLSAYTIGRKRSSCSRTVSSNEFDGVVESSASNLVNGADAGNYTNDLEGCNWLDAFGSDPGDYYGYIPGSTDPATKVYAAWIRAKANGIWSPFVSVGDGGAAIPGLLSATRSVSGGTISLNAKVPFHPYWTNQHDPYLTAWYNASSAPEGKIRGYIDDFNDVEFNWYSPDYNIFETYKAKGYIRTPAIGQSLYSFSDAVKIEEWSFEFRYPNESVDFPGGEVLDGIFEPHHTVHDGETEACVVEPCNRGTFPVSSNIGDNFRLRLLPDAVPKRFVKIYGNAGENYQLYYFDSDEEDPGWVRIPPRTRGAVGNNGLLGTWDVTKLNGENYTVVVRTPDPNNPARFNQDYISVGIGEQIEAGRFARVFTPFKRASLLFDPATLSGANKDLITINQVKLDEADFELPSGITPLGPIFDIKPDDIEIDPAHPVELNFVFTKDELEEMFGIDESAISQVTIYNLKENNVLEPIVTFRLPNCSHPDTENYGRHDGCLREEADKIRFTGILNHFSSYVIVKEGPVVPNMARPLIYPRPDGWDSDPAVDAAFKKPVEDYLYGSVVHFEGVLKDSGGAATVPRSFTVRYMPKGNDAALSGPIYSNTNPAFSFDFNTASAGLNGEYVLRFDTVSQRGVENTIELPMVIDNSAPVSTLKINGTDAAPGSSDMVNIYSVFEIIASDRVGNSTTSGVEKIEYRLNGGPWQEYAGPFLLFDLGVGPVRLDVRSVDKAGNVEEAKVYNLVIVDVNEQPQNADMPRVKIKPDGAVYSDGAQTWVSGRTRFSLEPDGGGYARMEYQTNDGDVSVYSDGFILEEGEGFYVIDSFTTDKFGARGERSTDRVIVDNTPPISEFEFGGHYLVTEEGVFVDEGSSITIRARDGGLVPSGVKRVEYKLDGGGWTAYSAPLGFEKSGALCIRSVDNVDNIEASPSGGECAHRLNIRYDDVMPQAMLLDVTKAFSPNGDGVKDEASFKFYNADNFSEDVFVTLVLEGGEGRKKYVLIDNERNNQGEFSFTWDGTLSGRPLPEGNYAYSFEVRDRRGNLSNVENGWIVLDTTPPDVVIIGSETRLFSPNEDGVAEVMQIDYELDDNLLNEKFKAGLVVFVDGTEIYRRIEDVNVPPHQKALVWNGLNVRNDRMPDGTYSYTIYAEDAAGNIANEEFAKAAVQGGVSIDRTPPSSNAVFDGKYFVHEDGTCWLGAGTKIGFETFDPAPGSGVDFVTYSVDGGEERYYTLPFEFQTEGLHTVSFRAVDRIGNREETKEARLYVDLTPPESRINIEGVYFEDDEYGLVVGRDTAIRMESRDGGAGVSQKYVKLSDRTLTGSYDEVIHLVNLEEGKYALQYWADDLAGNSEGVRTMDVYYDARPPRSRLIFGAPNYKSGGIVYVRGDTAISFETDSNRKEETSTYYSVDGGDFREAQEFAIPEAGGHKVAYYSQDALQNTEEKKVQDVFVDDGPPVTSASFSSVVFGGGVYHVPDDVVITLAAGDAGAGVAKTEYRWDEAPAYQAYTAPFGSPANGWGDHVIHLRSTDRLGQQEAAQSLKIEVAGLDAARTNQVIPRTLVIMVQSLDLRVDDPRPNKNVIEEVLSSIGGFYKIMSTDVNSVSEIVNEAASGIYNIFVFSTDAQAMRWDDRQEVDMLLSMLAGRVHGGDSLVTVLEGARTEGRLWEKFISDIDGNSKDGHYGKGMVVHVGTNPAMTGDRAAAREELKEVISGSVPLPHELARGEIADVQLRIANKSAYPASVGVDVMSNGTVVAGESLPASVAIEGKGEGFYRYLLYLNKDGKNGTLDENVTAAWESGLSQSKKVVPETFELQPGLGEKLGSLYDKLYYEHDPVLVKVMSNVSKLYYGLNDDGIKAEQKLLWVTDAIKEVGEKQEYEDIRYDLESALKLLGTALSFGAENQIVVSYSDSPVENFSDDTTQYAGEGGCVIAAAKAFGGEALLALFLMGLVPVVFRIIRLCRDGRRHREEAEAMNRMVHGEGRPARFA